MQLNGSCHCGGGYAINLGADNASLQVQGEDNLSVYQAGDSPARRHFCQICGSALWTWDPRWPELIHPFAAAIDTDLPVAPEHTHLMIDSKAAWVEIREVKHDKVFGEYPDESLAGWISVHCACYGKSRYCR